MEAQLTLFPTIGPHVLGGHYLESQSHAPPTQHYFIPTTPPVPGMTAVVHDFVS
ncbi:hypothetical protein KP509_1Z295200 [Ceratopteris richardii]|nr:hypothetical protein KP509_1Z295200 [Ceratopteris richardii]